MRAGIRARIPEEPGNPINYMLILASSSPRRKDLMTEGGLSFISVSPEVDEDIGEKDPVTLCRRLSFLKAEDVYKRNPGAYVIGADTIVELFGFILGKPADSSDAVRILKRLSGNTHTVYTGVTVFSKKAVYTDIEASHVSFPPMTEDFIKRYVADYKPFDKAGAYGLQELINMLPIRVEGRHDNVIGLPMNIVVRLLQKCGYAT